MTPMTEEYVLPLTTRNASLEIVGGKGRSLAQMANAGLAVPDGYYVTTFAYRRFVNDNNLQSEIINRVRPEVGEYTLSFAAASRSIQDLFDRVALLDTMVEEIKTAYQLLPGDDPAVAVRSSATAEDLPDMSFAGQQDTYLNVCGEAAVVTAVRDCWASLWTSRAISYRHEMGIPQDEVAMAVVVQLMVPSDVSGILFTANPATGERSEMIINASFGLGEAVVGGQVTPDTYIVDRQSCAVKETIIGSKEQQIVADGEDGTRLEDIAADVRGQSSLSSDAISELAGLALRAEAHFGIPQDIEWAFADGRLWMLQSRPITNLPPQPIEVSWEPPPPVQILARRQIVENIPDPCTPLFEQLYLAEGLETIAKGKKRKSPMVGGGQLFLTLNGFAYQRFDFPQVVGEKPKAPTEEEMEAAERKAATEEQKAKQARKDEEQSDPELEKQDLELFLAELSNDDREAFDDWAETAGVNDLAHAVTMPDSEDLSFTAGTKIKGNESFLSEWRDTTMPEIVATTEQWRQVDPGTASDEALLQGVTELAIASGMYWSSNSSHSFGVAKVTDNQLQVFLKETLPDHHFTSGQFLSGFRSTTTEANEHLFRIAQQIRNSDSLYELVMTIPAKRLMDALHDHPDSRDVINSIEDYLRIYGHLGYSLDFGEALPLDDPSGLLSALKTMVANRSYDPLNHEKDARRKRETAMAEIEQLLEGLQFWQFRYRNWFTRRFYYIREEVMYYLYWPWPVLRALALELGTRLAEAGTLATPDDVFYLYTEELTRAIVARAKKETVSEFQQLIAERRDLREAQKRLHPPGTIPFEASEHPGVKFKETQIYNDPNSDTLMGVPVSPGKVSAASSLITSPDEFGRMKPGSILVCSMTNPAWTPLFAHAAGLVTDMGGILGHGSIVAREYGIPAVVGTGIGTQRIKHEQEITVDGDAGTVVLSG
jgi:phosphohistidine swiveling domain-containing protein